MILTPEQIAEITDQWNIYAHSDLRDTGDDVFETIAAYAEIVQKIAETEEWWVDYDWAGMRCRFCYDDVEQHWDSDLLKYTEPQCVHEPDCYYLAARKLRGKP
jgi:hypothetical protein